GLIDQLEFEGFTTAQATYAVDNVVVDWNEQAVLSAQSYLDTYYGWSRAGLIDQLEFEGFTTAQATY
ncbi:Ltp family lipoprotein, partial [Demequina sp.]|uniref:Ltp family lipoprotein n=1 Tax=Demequina sp. TaxID=2050685 RepID=UPI0025BF36BC